MPVADGTLVPAARRALQVLRVLATHAEPLPATTIARELDLPRSTTYQLLTAMAAEGFVVHLPEERRYGLGLATFEVGSAWLRHGRLERVATPLLVSLAATLGHTAHLSVLHGDESLYLLKQQPPRPQPLVTDVGVRLPAHLTASGRSLLAALPAAQVRAVVRPPLVGRTGRGPTTMAELRTLLAQDRRRGWAEEHGFITPGWSSVAASSTDHTGRPTAAVGITMPEDLGRDHVAEAGRAVQEAAADLTARLSGRPRA